MRDSNVDPATLSWEDQLAFKHCPSILSPARPRSFSPVAHTHSCAADETLFKEYAVVNLKHYKSGAVRPSPSRQRSRRLLLTLLFPARARPQIALRWRTETEVLSGIGHLTCASLRCEYHEPSPSLLAALELDDAPPDPDHETPLVPARLEELEVPFGYAERGERKSVLVKVVLCRECAKKLRYGRRKAKEDRETAASGCVSFSCSLCGEYMREAATNGVLARAGRRRCARRAGSAVRGGIGMRTTGGATERSAASECVLSSFSPY